MQMLDETEAAVALEKVDEWHWLALIPICFAGRFIGKKLHLPTKHHGIFLDVDSSSRRGTEI